MPSFRAKDFRGGCMYKKLIAIMLTLAVLFSFAGCSAAETEDLTSHTLTSDRSGLFGEIENTESGDSNKTSSVTPLFYKVTDDDGDVLWLLGSIHIGDESFYPLPDYILSAFDGADTLAVEVDVIKYEKDMDIDDVFEPYRLPYGYTAKDYMDEETYEAACDIIGDEIIEYLDFNSYSPALWVQFVEEFAYMEMELDMMMGVDRHLTNRAYDQKKKVVDIEDPDEHMDIYLTFSDELIDFMLKDAIITYERQDEYKKLIEDMMESWKKGDKEGIVGPNVPDTLYAMTEEEKILYEEYNKKIMTDRDKIMIDYIKDALDTEEEVFVCVGAAHVLSNGGIVDTLKADGYKVEQVQ